VTFNDWNFLVFFLPAVMAVMAIERLRDARAILLTVASLVFYGLSGIEHLVVLIIDTIFVFAVCRSDKFTGNAARLACAISLPVVLLVYYKYLGFLVRTFLGIDEATRLFASFSISHDALLPAGISFFTFHLVAYAVDRYSGRIASSPKAVDFALFISFFPHLVAGPILRLRDVIDGLSGLRAYRLNREDVSIGTGLAVSGLFLKVVLADGLSRGVAPYVADPAAVAPLAAAYVITAYSLQIYFDFFGYSLVAIGLARFFGFHFPANFDRPYSSRNPRDFWRRWHMTLSYWLRDYLYLPLGGNRAYVRNILIVFAICGLWHGAGWNFVIWGLYHGVLVVLYHVTRQWWDRVWAPLQVGLTFALTSLGWVLFLFDWDKTIAFARALAGQGSGALGPPDAVGIFVVAMAALVCFFARFETWSLSTTRTPLRAHAWSATLALMFFVSLLFLESSQTFIYFRF